MEILATIEYKGWFIFFFLLVFAVTIMFFILFLEDLHFSIRDGFTYKDNVAMITLLIVSAILGFVDYNLYKDGAYVEYKAKITDFNQVHKNGYKIIGKEGKIYTLEKVNN